MAAGLTLWHHYRTNTMKTEKQELENEVVIGLGGAGGNIVIDLQEITPIGGQKGLNAETTQVYLVTGSGFEDNGYGIDRFKETVERIRNTAPHSRITGIVILPFSFEGKEAIQKWQEAKSTLETTIDRLVYISNDLLIKNYPDVGMNLMNYPICKFILQIMGRWPVAIGHLPMDVQEILNKKISAKELDEVLKA